MKEATIKRFHVDTAANIVGEAADPTAVWIKMKLTEAAGKAEQMSLNGYPPVEIFRTLYQAAKEIRDVVENDGVSVE